MHFINKIRFPVSLCAICVASAVNAGPLDLDTTFNSTGALSANYSDYTGSDSRTYFKDVETTSDGHIIAVGSATNTSSAYDGLIVKISPNGTLATNFDGNGKRFVSLGDDTRIEKVATLFDGKLLVLARTRSSGAAWRIELLRLNSDGTIDPSFGSNGKYSVPNQSGNNQIPKDIAVLSTGEIVVLYHEYFRTALGTDQYYSKALKLDALGNRVTSALFTANGFINPVIFGSGSDHSTEFNHLALDNSDNIYMSGRFLGIVNTAYVPNISMLNGKFDSNGNPQTFATFTAGNGRSFWYLHPDVSSTAPSSVPTDNNTLNSIVALPNGDVVSAGCNPDGQARIQRQTSTGAFVTSFGVNGVQTYDILPSDECFSEVAYHPTLGLILTGSNTANSEQMILQIDESTGSVIDQRAGGVFFTSTGNNHGGIAEATTILGNGKIVVAATTGVSNPSANDVQGALKVYQGAALTPSTTRPLNSLNFATDTNVALSSQMTSNSETVTITGTGSLSAQVAGGDLLVNGSQVTTPVTIYDGDALQLSHTSANTAFTDTDTYLKLNSGTGAHRSNNQWKSGDAISSYTSTTMSGDTTPDAYDLQPNSVGHPPEINVVVTSRIVTISGINIATPISITNGEYSVNGGAYTSASGIVNNGDTVQVRHTTANTYSTLTTTTLDIGGVTDTFVSATKTLDTTPNAYSLQPTVVGLPPELSVIVASNTITVSGINTATPISITDGEYSINGGTFTSTAGTVNNGDTVQVQHTTANAYSTLTTSTLDIGGVTDTFRSTTKSADTIADNLPAFIDYPGAPAPNEIITFRNSLKITGIDVAIPISISAAVSAEYSINGGAFTSSAGTVSNNDVISVRYPAAATHNSQRIVGLAIGANQVTNFRSTTAAQDNTPDAFSFVAQNDVDPNTTITSAATSITGFNTSVSISITNGEYSINGGGFTSQSGTVESGDQLVVRHTSSANNSETTTTEVTVGGVSASFSSTTSAVNGNTGTVSGATSTSGASFGLIWLVLFTMVSVFRRKQ